MTEHTEAAERVAASIAAEAAGDPATARAIWREAGRMIPKVGGPGRPAVTPDAATEKGWNVRVMLFAPNGELEGDTMPDAAPETTPDTYVNTLALAGQWLRDTANMFHTERREPLPVGLDDATLARSILSLRVTLSRNGGASWWRLPYKIGDESWRAMVRVERAVQ